MSDLVGNSRRHILSCRGSFVSTGFYSVCQSYHLNRSNVASVRASSCRTCTIIPVAFRADEIIATCRMLRL